ncbi:hypothetical protein COBT_003004, partial [Conglomerata obtusa]
MEAIKTLQENIAKKIEQYKGKFSQFNEVNIELWNQINPNGVDSNKNVVDSEEASDTIDEFTSLLS